MTVNPVRYLFAITLVFAVAGGTRGWSQDSVKPKDEALDSLIEKLANPDAKQDSKPVKRAEACQARIHQRPGFGEAQDQSCHAVAQARIRERVH